MHAKFHNLPPGSVMLPSAMSSSYAHHQHPVLWTGPPPSTRPRIAGSTAPPAHRGRGDHIIFSTPLRGVSNPTAPINKTPHSGVHRAPAHRGRGDHIIFSTPLRGWKREL